jgi:hypothetical protein
MTDEPVIKKRLKIEPQPGTRLELLMAEHDRAKVEADAAKEKEDELKAAIQGELSALADPDSLPDAFDIPADPAGRWEAYSYRWVNGGWRIDSKAMQEQDPVTYVKWAKKSKGHWEFSAVRKRR